MTTVVRQTAAEAGSKESQPAGSRPDTLYHAVLLVMACGITLLSLLLSVRGGTHVIVPVIGLPLPEMCYLRRLVGINCPGCGMTRCFISLAHGDLAAAWSYNPAGLLLFVVVALQIPFRAAQLWRISRGLPELGAGRLAQIVLGVLTLALFAQWILRLTGIGF